MRQEWRRNGQGLTTAKEEVFLGWFAKDQPEARLVDFICLEELEIEKVKTQFLRDGYQWNWDIGKGMRHVTKTTDRSDWSAALGRRAAQERYEQDRKAEEQKITELEAEQREQRRRAEDKEKRERAKPFPSL